MFSLLSCTYTSIIAFLCASHYMHVYFRMFHLYINVYFFFELLLFFFCWPGGLHCNSEENQNKTSLYEQIKVFKFTLFLVCVCECKGKECVCVWGGGGGGGSGDLNALKLRVIFFIPSLSFAESTNTTMTSLSIVANLIAKSVLLVIVSLYKNNHTQ